MKSVSSVLHASMHTCLLALILIVYVDFVFVQSNHPCIYVCLSVLLLFVSHWMFVQLSDSFDSAHLYQVSFAPHEMQVVG